MSRMQFRPVALAQFGRQYDNTSYFMSVQKRKVYSKILINNNNNNNNTQLLSCHVSTDTVKTVGVESQARVVVTREQRS